MADDQGSAEVNVQIDSKGNLVLKGLDRDALDRLRQRLENAKVDASLLPSPKLRVEAIIA